MISIFSSNYLNAAEIEQLPTQKNTSEISVAEGTYIYQEDATIAENIYIAPGTIISGTENINLAGNNYNTARATKKEKSLDEDIVLGISKAFVPQQKVKDLVLKSKQDKSNQKVKNTFVLSLANSSLPILGKTDYSINVINCSSSNSNFGTLQISRAEQISNFKQEIDNQAINPSFLFLEKYKNRKIFLRGPPSIIAA